MPSTALPSRVKTTLGSIAIQCALLGLYGMCFLGPFSTSARFIGLALMVPLLAHLVVKNFRAMISEPTFYLSLLFIVYVTMRSLVAALETPELSGSINDAARQWARGFLLPAIMVACTLATSAAHVRHSRLALLLGLLGTLLAIFMNMEWHNLGTGLLKVPRQNFGIAPLATAGMLLSIVLLGSGVFCIASADSARSVHRRFFLIFLWGCTILVLGLALFLTGTRAAWIGFLIASIVLIGCWLLRGGTKLPSRLFTSVLFGCATFTVLLNTPLGARITTQMEPLIAGFRALPASESTVFQADTVGIRAAANIYGIRLLAERPVFGHGPINPYEKYGPPQTPAAAALADHLHNSFLDIFVRFGIFGGALFFFAATTIARRGYSSWRQQTIPSDIGAFLLGAFIIQAIVHLTDARLVHSESMAIISVLGGILLAPTFKTRLGIRDR